MIIIKTDKEIEAMKEGGHKLAGILKKIAKRVKPGINTRELEDMALSLITQAGGEPSFKGYANSRYGDPYDSALCVSINEEVVHCSPLRGKALKAGDIVGIDIGMKYKGYHTDMAVSVGVGKISKEARKLLKVTREALELAIGEVKSGKTLGDIGYAVENLAKENGFSVVRQLAGHGVGKEIHEDPQVLNYGQPGKGLELKPGMTIAIEPMINAGKHHVIGLDDGWGIATQDNSLSAHFEHTIAVTKKGCEVLTR